MFACSGYNHPAVVKAATKQENLVRLCGISTCIVGCIAFAEKVWDMHGNSLVVTIDVIFVRWVLRIVMTYISRYHVFVTFFI